MKKQENMRAYVLYYMVLFQPMAGMSPQDIRLSELMVRLQKDVDEGISSLPIKTLEGDTTATYISKLIKPLGIIE